MAFRVENLHGGVFEFIHQFSWRPIWRLPHFPRCHSGIDMLLPWECDAVTCSIHGSSSSYEPTIHPVLDGQDSPIPHEMDRPDLPVIKQHLSNNSIYETNSLDITSSCHNPPFQNICSLGNPECSLSSQLGGRPQRWHRPLSHRSWAAT